MNRESIRTHRFARFGYYALNRPILTQSGFFCFEDLVGRWRSEPSPTTTEPPDPDFETLTSLLGCIFSSHPVDFLDGGTVF